MDTDKAYLLGLIIGGGAFGNTEDIFHIRLPYKQWGSYEKDPKVASQISKDILQVVGQLFRATYGIIISYDTSTSGIWNILCEGDLTDLIADLTFYGIDCNGEIRKHADISKIIPDLIDDNLKRRFIAGLADTIGSTKSSHRRFTDDKQMISFEISGFEFNFVCSLCKLLHSIKCYPDQILWNHPNFHSASNPYYKNWKKGFKLRVYLDQYDKFGAFAFTSKAQSAKQNKLLEKQENVGIPCETREIKSPSVSCVHCDEYSLLLPKTIRGGHYIHNRHVCAVLNCDHAPFNEIAELLGNAQNYINPFPVLLKGTIKEVQELVDTHTIYKNRLYKNIDFSINELYEKSKENENQLMFSSKNDVGYPLNKIILGIAYLIAAKTGQLHGSRPKGNKETILADYIQSFPNTTVKIRIPELLTPIIITLDDYAAMIGPQNPDVYKKLIEVDKDNKYKIYIREITEADLQ